MNPKIQTLKFKELRRKTFFKLGIRIYFCAIVATSYYLFISIYSGYKVSSIFTAMPLIGFLISLYVFVVKRNYVFCSYIVYVSLGVATLALSYLEGLMSGYYWFQLGLIFSLPYVIPRGTYFKKHISILYSSTILCLVVSFIISPMYSEFYTELSKEDIHYRFILNSSINFLLIMVFSLQALSHSKFFIKKISIDKQLAENEKERRTRVLSNLGHELRTQVNSINGVTQLILGGDLKEAPSKKYFEILDYCNENMLLLVNDMLDIHKIESGHFELFKEPKALYKFLNKITIPFISKAEEKNLELLSYIDVKLKDIIVNVDEKRIAQVVYNLISNAIKFTEQGKITFSVKVIELNKTDVDLQFKVEDTGIGIAPNNLKKIFESFHQIKNEKNPVYGGTGLGLAISQSIIDAMNSEINVESRLGEGTCFQFLLRLNRVENLPNKLKKEVDFKDDFFLESTILVVEDNMVSMMYAKKLLEKHVTKVYQGANGVEAIERIKAHKDIDLVLLDLEMPVMNGFKAIKHIKKIRPDVIVIAFTANIPSTQILNKLDNLGFDDILSKPFNKQDLFTALQKYTPQTEV